MSVNITSVGASIKIEITAHTDGYPPQNYFLNKAEADIKASGTKISLGDENKIFHFEYANITLPVSVDINDLAQKLNNMLTNNVVQYAGVNVLKQFSDFHIAITYFDQGTPDERIDNIVYSSVLSGLPNITATMSYVGGPTTYSLSNVQYS